MLEAEYLAAVLISLSCGLPSDCAGIVRIVSTGRGNCMWRKTSIRSVRTGMQRVVLRPFSEQSKISRGKRDKCELPMPRNFNKAVGSSTWAPHAGGAFQAHMTVWSSCQLWYDHVHYKSSNNRLRTNLVVT